MTDSILTPGARTEPIVSPTGRPVPVTLLSGFLGAGKTTLRNRILNGDHGLRVGVLVNDFGAVNIDADLIEGVEENTINLSNGCVCCEVRDDLVSSLEELLLRRREIDYVILEASGIADPEGVVMTFLDAKYEDLLRLDSITCIVDADGVYDEDDDQDVAILKLRQIGFADLVILNKVDLVGPEYTKAIRGWIDGMLNRVRIVETEFCDVPLEILLAVGRFDPGVVDDLSTAGSAHAEGTGFVTWHYTSAKQLSLAELREVIRTLPAAVYRCKGFVYTEEDPDERFVIQTVGRRSTVASLGAWGERARRTDLVLIGAAGSLDTDELQRRLDQCRVG